MFARNGVRNNTGVSRILLVAIIVVLVVIAGAAYMLLPKGPPQPSTTTTTTTPKPTTTQTTATTAKTTETTATTPTTTSKTTSSLTSPTATETTAATTETTKKTTETVETTSSASPPEIEYIAPSSVADLVKVAKSMTYKWTSPEETMQYNYDVLGEETVEGLATWKVKIQFANKETQNFTVWVSQVDGVVKQVEVGGTTITGEMAKNHPMLVPLMLPFVIFGGYNWVWREYWKVPSDVGVVTYQGSQTQSFGPTPLTVEKFRFVPNPLYEPTKDTKYVEWGFAKLGNLGITTHFKGENKDGEVLFDFDLLSVTLAPGVL